VRKREGEKEQEEKEGKEERRKENMDISGPQLFIYFFNNIGLY